MIFKLAFRNLFSNKVKSGIIVALMALATFLTVLGFGILNYSKQQTENVCRSDYCGDIFISGKVQKSKGRTVTPTMTGPFTMGVSIEMPTMPYLMQSDKILEKLKTIDSVADFSRGVSVSGGIKRPNLDEDTRYFSEASISPDDIIGAYFLGINSVDHKRMYNSIIITEGSVPETGAFLIIPNELKKRYKTKFNQSLNIGDVIFLTAFSRVPKTIEMKVSAFYDYAHPETDISYICYIDLRSNRILGNMTVGAQTASEIPDSIDLTASELSEEDLFSGAFEVVQSSEDYSDAETDGDLLSILGDTELRDSLNMPDSDSWHYITVKLDNKIKTADVIKELNSWFEENDIEAQAASWDTAMHFYAQKLDATKKLMIIILVLLSIVSLVVIMNTLVVSIMERTSEIGTMRAIGAKKGFVRKMFLAESFALGVAGLLVGIVLAVVAGSIFNIFGMPAGDIGKSLFGFSVIRVSLGLSGIGLTSVIIIVASLLATVYPLAVALQISPLEAINKN